MRRAPDPIERQAALLYDHLMHAPGTERLALATARAGRALPSEAAIREACLLAAARDVVRGVRTVLCLGSTAQARRDRRALIRLAARVAGRPVPTLGGWLEGR